MEILRKTLQKESVMKILCKTLEKESDGDPMQDPGEGECD